VVDVTEAEVTVVRKKPGVETFQAPFELEQLVTIFEQLQPASVLEVGCWHGGTLWHWLQQPGATVVAIDDEMRMGHVWEDWADEAGSTLHLLRGSSHDPELIEAARDLGPYEFVFIDADHTYQAVRADWDNFRPMVARGGVVAFHDIVPRPGYGVSEVWEEIRGATGARWVEIVETVAPENESRCGIGVVWL
jgi:cephalosporin hydroxylase